MFIHSFQFLYSSLDSLVKILSKDDFRYLSQEFDSEVLDLVKKKGFYSFEYMRSFEKLKERFPFVICCLIKKISDKEYEHAIQVWAKFEFELSQLVLKM